MSEPLTKRKPEIRSEPGGWRGKPAAPKQRKMKETGISSPQLAGEPGFEPGLDGPGPSVLPLDYSPSYDVAESKSGRFSGVVNDILPSILPQKRGETGQLLQSQLYNPPNIPIISPHPADINAPIFHFFSLALLKSHYQTLTRKTKKYAFPQMARAWMPANYGGREVRYVN